MSFVVEDGTGLANANAYIDTTFADAYFADRGVAGWTGTSVVKQNAIVRATDYIEIRFSQLFKGAVLTTVQSLAWPRQSEVVVDGVYYADPDFPTGVPVQVKKACAEYALRALTTTLAPDPEVDASGRPLIMKSEKIGPITETTQYVPGTRVSIFKPYPAADALLRQLISNGARVIRG